MNTLPSASFSRLLRQHRLLRELCAAFIIGLLLLQSAHAAAPAWWTSRNIVAPGKPSDDYAALNQGQLKNFVRAAIYELHDKLPGGAGNLLYGLLNTWRTQKLSADDYAIVTVGQLKAVAKPVYEAMQAAGMPIPVPWSSLTTDDDDYAAANIGQAKAVFAFAVPNLVTLGRVDTDADGFSDAVEQAMGTDPASSSSKPAGTGDVPSSGDPNTGGDALPPYVDPYADIPWPEFDGTADANLDSDGDTVPDVKDRVPYDPSFSEPRSGMPHYNIVDMGTGSFSDMADNGAMLWQDGYSVSGNPIYKVWTPAHPEAISFTWDPYAAEDYGLQNAYFATLSGSINEDGSLVGVGYFVDLSPGGLAENQPFLFHPSGNGGTAGWLPRPVPDAQDESYLNSLNAFVFGPGGRLYGTNTFGRDNGGQTEGYTTFFSTAGASISFDGTTVASVQPSLPATPPAAGTPLTPPGSLGTQIGDAVTTWQSLGSGGGGGLLRSTSVETHAFYQQVVAGADNSVPDSRAWAGMADPDYSAYTLAWELVTESGAQLVKVTDLTSPEDAWIDPITLLVFPRWSFGPVAPGSAPWFAGMKSEGEDFYDWTTWTSKAWIYKPDTTGTYQPHPIYASKSDYAAQKPISSIGLITAPGQAFVYGDFDEDPATEDQTGLWADGRVQAIDKVVSGYDRYENWIFTDVSRDGMVAAMASRQVDGQEEWHVLLLIPFTTREIKGDGKLGAAGSGVKASLPSPVFCDHVENGVPVDDAVCELRNPRLLVDGSVVGDIFISGAVHSKACDFIKGEKGTITQAQFWVNGADTPHAVIDVEPDKNDNGPSDRPYSYEGTFETTLQNVPLTSGVNHFKITAEDEIYHYPGHCTWYASINVSNPEDDTAFNHGGGGNPAGVFALRIQLPAATLASETADTVFVSLNLNGVELSNLTVTETASANGVFVGNLSDSRQVRLTLAEVSTLSSEVSDALLVTLLLGDAGSAVSYQVATRESTPSSGLFSGGYATGGSVAEGNSNNGGGTASGGDTTNAGGTNGGGNTENGGVGGNNDGNGGANNANIPPQPGPVVSIERYAGLVEKSNGGEFYRYAVGVGIPDDLLEHFAMTINEEDYHVLKDEDTGLIVLRSIDRPKPVGISFIQNAAPSPSESDLEHQKRMEAMKDKSWVEGFGYGIGLSVKDMVTDAGEMVGGALKFLGNGAVGLGLSFRWRAEWMVGADTAATETLLLSYSQQPSEVVEGGVNVLSFLGSLLNETGASYPKVLTGLMTGDPKLIKTALHGSEVHLAIFMMISEALTEAMKDYDTGTPGERGYVAGRIFSGAVSIVAPYAKGKILSQLSKLEVLAKIKSLKVVQATTKTLLAAKEALLRRTKMCFEAGVPVRLDNGHHIGIEQVYAGMHVWSRDEVTGHECLKQVVETVITHPVELYRLTYQLRGPPKGAPELSQASPAPLSETIGVTSPHPFWVSNRSIPGFTATEDLAVGDVLFLSSGREATVTHKVLEHAPAGETFTTYNFEVADFHTYFVGMAEVWVHNLAGRRARCEMVAELYENARQDAAAANESPLRTLARVKQEVFEKAVAAGNAMHDVPSETWGRAAAVLAQDMLNNYGGLNDVPSFATWRQLYFNDLRRTGFFLDEVSQGGVDIHHVVEKYIQKLLKIDKILWDTSPGVPLPRNKKALDALNAELPAEKQLKAIHKGMEDGGISGILQSQIPVNTDMSPQEIINKLRQIYMNTDTPEFSNLWPPARDYLRDLQAHGFLDVNLTIPR